MKNYRMKPWVTWKNTIYLLILTFLMLLLSCVGANQGGLRLSRDVSNLFESFQVLDDHNYYYSGPDNRPHGILGIHKDYVLRSRLWKPVELTPDQLKLWVRMMTDHRGTSIRPYGSRIVAPDGSDIGVWYSPWNQTSVKFEDDRHVVIGIPTPSPMNIKRGLFFGVEDD